MKISGQEIKGPNHTVVVIPRPPKSVPQDDGSTEEVSGDIVFKLQAVLDYTEFEQLCPAPKPPNVLRRGMTKPVPDFDDPKFRVAVGEHAERHTHFMVLKSLSVTPDLEWETVKMNDPTTWKNFITELASAGFSTIEVNRIINEVGAVNGLDEGKFEEARQRFLHGQVKAG